MSVSTARVDNWISHLAFASPRPSQYGQMDGLFMGLLSVEGDVSGGTVSLDGDLSEERKGDWVHILGGWCLRSPADVAGQGGYVEFQTGPKIVGDGDGIDVPTFTAVDSTIQRSGAAADPMSALNRTGLETYVGLPLYADPHVAGSYQMIHGNYEINTDGDLYTLSIWGFLIRYQSFFRGVPPGLS